MINVKSTLQFAELCTILHPEVLSQIKYTMTQSQALGYDKYKYTQPCILDAVGSHGNVTVHITAYRNTPFPEEIAMVIHCDLKEPDFT